MEHPLIASLDSLNEQQLLDKIAELNKKLSIAYRGGNQYLCNQLRMAIETYQNSYQLRIKKDSSNNFDQIIDIS